MKYVKLKKNGLVPEFMTVKQDGKTYRLPFGGVFEVSEKQKEIMTEKKPYPVLSAKFVSEYENNFEIKKIKTKEK